LGGGVAVAVAILVAGMGSARAFLSETPTLPLLDSPYTIGGGTCFPIAQFCVAGGELTLTSVVPGGFVQSGSNQFITAYATDVIQVNNLSSVPVGTVTLTGTVEQAVIGRLNPDDQGSWTTDLISLSLSGTLAGYPVTLALNPADLALDTGTTSIAQDGAFFDVSSYFDVFATVSYNPPGGLLTATPSGTATATPAPAPAPEPATLALFGGSLLVMSAVRRRRA
jgi:hypothetical protein